MVYDWGVSIVVCCHNSSGKLPGTLDALFRLKRQSFPIEVIIVDNNSKDDTAGTAERHARECGVEYLRIVREEHPGLSFARRAGVLAAAYEVIIFCDDDNHLCDEYAVVASSIFLKNPKVGVIGGLGREKLGIEPPEWWPMFSKSYAVGLQGDSPGPVKISRGYVYGAGMCVRKSVMMKLFSHNFPPLLKDRKGGELSSGGDVEMCFLVRAMGYEVWFDDRLCFEHAVDKNRLTWEHYLRLKKGITQSFPVTFSFRLFNRHTNVSNRLFLTQYLRSIRSMVRLYYGRESNPYKAEVNKLVARCSLFFLVLRPFLMARTHNRIKKIVAILSQSE